MSTLLFSKSKSVQLSIKISPHLAPVSLRICRKVAAFACSLRLTVDFVFFGMKGSFLTVSYFGGSQVPPTIFRNECRVDCVVFFSVASWLFCDCVFE